MSKVKERYLDEIFGEVIHSYSREKAIADGVLVDLNQFVPIVESGYKYPVACTATVWGIINAAVENKRYCNDYEGVIWDILHMSRNFQIKKWETGCSFQVIIKGAGAKTQYQFKIECGPGDQGEPVLTIMLLNED